MNAKLPDILRHTATNKISEDIFYNHIDIVKKYYEKNDTDSNRILILEEGTNSIQAAVLLTRKIKKKKLQIF